MRTPLRRLLPLAAGLACLTAAAQDIQPFRAQEVKPYQAQEVRPRTAQPGRRQDPAGTPSKAGQAPSIFFGTFGLSVPGVAYSWDNLAAQTRTNVVAAGVVTKGAVRINPDGTYVWNSAWEGRVIQGRWVPHRDGILLQQAQEHRDWVMGRLPNPSGSAVVYLYDGNYMTYHGTPKPGGR